MRNATSIVFFAACGILAPNFLSCSRPELEPLDLAPGEKPERELRPGEAHAYSFELAPHHYLDLEVDQRGVDVVLRLFDPQQRLVTEIDSPTSSMEREFLQVLGDATQGSHSLEVRAWSGQRAPGRYAIRVLDHRRASERDRCRVEAERIHAEADALRRQGTWQSLPEAAEKYRQVLDRWDDCIDDMRRAIAHSHLCTIHRSLFQESRALDHCQQARQLLTTQDSPVWLALTLHNMGALHETLADSQEAIPFYEKALELRRGLGHLFGQAITANDLGLSYHYMGQHDLSRTHLESALAFWRQLDDGREEAKTLMNLGGLHVDWGQRKLGLDRLTEALERSRQARAPAVEAMIRTHLGYFFINQDIWTPEAAQVSLDHITRALEIHDSPQVEDPRGQAMAFMILGYVHRRLAENAASPADRDADLGAALGAYERALELYRQVGDRRLEVVTLDHMGWLHVHSRAPHKAMEVLEEALLLSDAKNDPISTAFILAGMARAQRQLADLHAARRSSEAALELIESRRAQTASHGVRWAFFASNLSHYQFYIDLLMELDEAEPGGGYAALALEASERTRGRSLLETLAEMGVDVERGVDGELLRERRRIEAQLDAREGERRHLLAAVEADPYNQRHLQQVEVRLRELLSQYEDVQARIRLQSPSYRDLTRPQPVELEQIQDRLLDPNSVLLEYKLGKERSFLWVVTPTSLHAFKLPARESIERQATEAYELLKVSHGIPRAQTRETLMRLGEMLLDPQLGELIQGKRLVIVSDGILQYIPFGALPEPRARGEDWEPLIVGHEVVSLPSASVLSVIRRELGERSRAPGVVAVVADPVFDLEDERVEANGHRGASQASEYLPRLRFSHQEADAIERLAPPDRSLVARGFDATRQMVLDGRLSGYRIVHFATHGVIDAAYPQLSRLVLSRVDRSGRSMDGDLYLRHIYNLSLPAELVVLSACETALGQQVRGEGLVGLTRGFFYAGVPRLVVSLWRVDDRATAELMKRFYHHLLVEGQRPAAALRAAQVSMLRQEQWQAPINWAGFVLQGEWH